MEINERIFFLLKQQKKTAKDLGIFIGVNPASISAWKNGGSFPSSKHVIGISKFLEVSPSYLLTGEGEMRPQKELPTNPQILTDYEREAAETCLHNLTVDQAALINCYEKLDPSEKEDIWAMIKHKLSRKTGLDSSSLTSKDGLDDESKTA